MLRYDFLAISNFFTSQYIIAIVPSSLIILISNLRHGYKFNKKERNQRGNKIDLIPDKQFLLNG